MDNIAAQSEKKGGGQKQKKRKRRVRPREKQNKSVVVSAIFAIIRIKTVIIKDVTSNRLSLLAFSSCPTQLH
jgi:hypothetical protein